MIGWRFLEEMDLAEFSGCDLDLVPILDQIPPGSDFIDVRSYLQHTLVENLYNHISAGGSSILLDTSKMKGTTAEVLLPLIEAQRTVELRRAQVRLLGRELVQYDVYMNESKSLFIPDCVNFVDLENLWMTAIGFQILSDLGFGLYTDGRGLKQVQKLIGKVSWSDQRLSFDASHISIDTKMSPAMKSIICRQIHNS